MTITISGLNTISMTKGSSLTAPFSGLVISDSISQNVAIAVTQQNFLHSDLGANDDVKTPIGTGTFSSSSSAQVGPNGSVTIPLGSLSATTSPLAVLRSLTFTPPTNSLNKNAAIETDLTLTVTDDSGSAPMTATEKLAYTNPVSLFFTSYQTSVGNGSAINPTLYVNSTTTFSLNGTKSTSFATISINTSNVLHSDFGAADDVVTVIGAGTWGAFNSSTGAATNSSLLMKDGGSLSITGDLNAVGGAGVYDPFEKTYSAHDYSIVGLIDGTPYSPPAMALTGNQAIETTFTATETDSNGNSNSSTSTVKFTNPAILTGYAADTRASFAKLPTVPVTAFTVNGAFGSALAATATVTQHNVIHTDFGAADDQIIAVGPGKLSLNSTYTGTANFSTVATTGAVTVSGVLNSLSTFNSSGTLISSGSSPITALQNLLFTVPSVTLTGNAVLESDFTFSLTDSAGDTASPTTVSDFFYAPIATASSTPAPTPTPTPTSVSATPTGSGTSGGSSVAPITTETTSAVYRFFDKVDGTHFFTSSASERDGIISSRPDMVEETNGFGDVTSATPDAVAVYRFFDTVHGTHFFTSSASERDTVLSTRSDLTYESSATFYELSTDTGGNNVAVYRLFDTQLGTHFYTGDANEYQGLTTAGSATFRADLKPEGVSFYAPSGSFT